MVLLSQIEESVAEQRNWVKKVRVGIDRKKRRDIQLQPNYVTILTGIRRCGKSTLMFQLIREIGEDFGYFNFEDSRTFGFDVNDFTKLEQAMGDCSYYFFDEIQNIENWEIFVRKLHDRGKIVCITGSNASLLSKELGTKLTGRHVQIELFPFDFDEYCTAKKVQKSEEIVKEYLNFGGFPNLVHDFQIRYLQQLFSDILYRDIIARYGIRNVKTVEGIALFLISNSGKEFSLNGIKKVFSVGSANSVADYVTWLENSYLLYSLPRFSWSAKVMAVNPKKIYTVDTGFAKANSLSFSDDKGRLFENWIYIQLRQSGQEMYYFREKGECDFILKSQKSFRAIQVCYQLTPDNLDRELNGLLEAMTFFELTEGVIVTQNQNEVFCLDGKNVEAISVDRWLEIV